MTTPDTFRGSRLKKAFALAVALGLGGIGGLCAAEGLGFTVERAQEGQGTVRALAARGRALGGLLGMTAGGLLLSVFAGRRKNGLIAYQRDRLQEEIRNSQALAASLREKDETIEGLQDRIDARNRYLRMQARQSNLPN